LSADRLSAIIWLVIGGTAVYGSISLGLGTTREPGSGFLPFLASVFICLLALIIFFNSWKIKPGSGANLFTLWQDVRWKRPLAVGLITVGYILVFGLLGFALSTFLFLFILFRSLERLAWKKNLLISLVSTGFCYFLLRFSLEASLPKGIFGF